jgi:hypothetical protein
MTKMMDHHSFWIWIKKKDMQKNGFDQSEPIDVANNAIGRLEI